MFDLCTLLNFCIHKLAHVFLFSSQYYQDLFRGGECFLHIVSLLNGTLDEENGEKLVLHVLKTLTCLLRSNDVSKVLPTFCLFSLWLQVLLKRSVIFKLFQCWRIVLVSFILFVVHG